MGASVLRMVGCCNKMLTLLVNLMMKIQWVLLKITTLAIIEVVMVDLAMVDSMEEVLVGMVFVPVFTLIMIFRIILIIMWSMRMM
ncbi:hypothetical protein PR202_ga25538 [Eleusine coracana subsp. coracana]|uniref:Transmembrane protein n=1 Tax=Eleusine coracana subsp. coracana TaxID=191504 RepID=A0AAV5DAE0_ELECO|nr:hypothetical protein PR202_ga25538 [Eleusine coracana subsp. coracana]